MKVLFYLNPESDLLVANTLAQWAVWLLRIHHGLKNTREDYEATFIGHSSAAAYFNRGGERFCGIASAAVSELIRQCNAYRTGGCGAVDSPNLNKALGLDFQPDVVVSIGDAKYLECLWSEAIFLHVEMSPLYRLLNVGLRFCVTFTDRHKLSDLVHHLDSVVALDIGEPVREALTTIKSEIRERVRNEPLNQELTQLRRQYERICLIPLAEPWFSPLRVKVFDLLNQLLAASDSQELFVLSHHPLAQALTEDQLLALRADHPNILLASDVFPGVPTQSFYPHCQVVYTDFSNAVIDSLFFDDINYRSALATSPDLLPYANFRNPLSSYMNALSRTAIDAILYTLIKCYTIHEEKFFDARWWNRLLSPWQMPLTFAQIEARLA